MTIKFTSLGKIIFFKVVTLLAVLSSCNSNVEIKDAKKEEKSSSTELAATINQSKDPVKLQVSNKEPYGSYLSDSKGIALYMFKADSKNKSSCFDACAKAWPPLMADGKVQAGDKVNSKMIGTIERKTGGKQVTYNGWPLYYYIQDKSKGDTKGQDVMGFGAEWYLLSPQGEVVHAEGEAHKGDEGHSH